MSREKMPTPEEMAKLSKERRQKERELEEGGAQEVFDEKGNVYFEATAEQKNKAKEEMNKDLKNNLYRELNNEWQTHRANVHRENLNDNESRIFVCFEKLKDIEEVAKTIDEERLRDHISKDVIDIKSMLKDMIEDRKRAEKINNLADEAWEITVLKDISSTYENPDLYRRSSIEEKVRKIDKIN